jgi:hypothetical protein
LDVGLVAAVALWAVLWAWLQWTPSAISWHFFTEGAHALVTTSGLHLYAQHPTLQIGPLTFVITAALNWLPAHTGQVVAQVLMMAVGPLLVWWLAPLVPRDRRVVRITLAALVLVPAWSILAIRWGHLDDVLAMVFAVAAVRAVVGGRGIWAGLAIAAAISCKPWAVGFVPLLLVLERRRLASFVAAGVALLVAWMPFLLADAATLRAFRPRVPVSSDAGLYFWGYRGKYVPQWGRTAQLLAAPLIALLAVLRNRWPGLFIAAFAIRLALDPQDLPYYVGAAALSAVLFDLLATRWVFPWMTIVAVLVLWQPFVADFALALKTSHGWALWWYSNQPTVGAIHVLWAAAVIAFVLFAPQRWLGLQNPTLPQWRLSHKATVQPDGGQAIATGSM